MKKILMGSLLMICFAVFLMGCAQQQEVKENTQVEDNVEKDKSEASENVFGEFTQVLESKDLLKTKKFILDNVDEVDEKTVDKMVMKYELLLNEKYPELADKFNSMKYFEAVNDTMNENYELNLEAIKDEKIKKEVIDVVNSGYTFESLEGSYYLTMDYAMINNTFSSYLSDNLKPYYELRKKELENPTFVEEYVSIDFKEIKNRIVTLETIIRDNKDFENKDILNDIMRWYVQALLSVDYVQGTVDYETGKVDDIVKNTYEELEASDFKILKYVAGDMDNLLSEYNYVLKPDDQEAYQRLNDLKFKLSKKASKMVEEYYN